MNRGIKKTKFHVWVEIEKLKVIERFELFLKQKKLVKILDDYFKISV